jgi:predicted metal-binding membrane protein
MHHALERILKQDRLIVGFGLGVVVAASWTYILLGAGMDAPVDMGAMMAAPAVWSAGYAIAVFVMWWVMMVAMMLPSAVPMILLYVAASRKISASAEAGLSTFVLASGYLAAWGAFSIIAVAAQWFLSSQRLLTPMLDSASVVLGGSLLIAAGAYQLTPLKDACLRHCRTPLFMVMNHWRPGTLGAFRMGCEHGAFCLGCCWVLMGLLFYGGVMNLAWIAGLAAYVLIEKLAPMGVRIGRYAGGLLMVWGAVILWSATLD